MRESCLRSELAVGAGEGLSRLVDLLVSRQAPLPVETLAAVETHVSVGALKKAECEINIFGDLFGSLPRCNARCCIFYACVRVSCIKLLVAANDSFGITVHLCKDLQTFFKLKAEIA